MDNRSAEYRREVEADRDRLLAAARIALDLIDRCQHLPRQSAVCQDCSNRASNYLKAALGNRA